MRDEWQSSLIQVSRCLIGGASFGGIVALEMARHLSAVGCLLIGSIRPPKELPWKFRRLRMLTVFGPGFLWKVASFGARHGHWLLSKSQIRRLRKLARPEASFVRWAICAVLNWKPAPGRNVVPIYQIQGSADEVLPISLTRPDVVAGGVHALTLFSPTEVNRFITDVINTTMSR